MQVVEVAVLVRSAVRGTRAAAWLAWLALALAAPVLATEITPDWQHAVTIGTQALYGAMVAVDGDDNIYVTGSWPGAHIVSARYDQAGNQIWRREFDNPGTREQARWVTVDPFGNLIICGYLISGASQEPSGFVTLSYDPNGLLRWSDVISVPRGVTARVVTDAAGNAYVIGSAWVTTDEMMTVKYAPDGTREWIRTDGVDATSADRGNSAVVTAAGHVIVAGGAIGWMLTVEYDPTGGVVWRALEADASPAGDVAVAPSGDVYAVGTTWTSTTGNQFLIVRYDSAGNRTDWRMYPGYAATRVVVDSQDHVIVSGYATGLPGRAYADWLTHRINPAGAVLWTHRYDAHEYNDEFPYHMVLGPDDEVYITGQGGPGPPSGNLSYLRTVTVRYDADGAEPWTASTFDSVRGLGVARAGNGSVVVVGESPYLVLHYFPCAAPPGIVSDLRAVRQGVDVSLSWQPATGARGYNVWTVAQRADIDLARAASAPPAVGVVGCAPPSPAAADSCVDSGGVVRPTSPLFYQVRGACGAATEGP